MSGTEIEPVFPVEYHHMFLGADHARAERATWAVIVLCGAMMVIEIVGGLMFGSIALVADGLHMSTHAGAMLLAALAYGFARRHACDPRFSFGTGKLGDLAGFASAVVLAMIALLIAYEALDRLLHPVSIRFGEAMPIACLGLAINLASVWLLGASHSHTGHSHAGHSHGGHDHGGHDHAGHTHAEHGHHGDGHHGHHDHDAHSHHAPAHGRDNNMRAAVVHVMADAAVSVLVIVGLLLARLFGWGWTDPVVGLIGAVVIVSWSYGLIRDTGAILLDMTADAPMQARIRAAVEAQGDRLADLHVWRLGPGHLGAILSVTTSGPLESIDYRKRLAGLATLSHVTIEVNRTS